MQHLGARVLCGLYRPAICRRLCPAAHDSAIQRNAQNKNKTYRSSCRVNAAALATATLVIAVAAVIAASATATATATATAIDPLGKKRCISVSNRAGRLLQLAAEHSAGTILRFGG